MREATISVAFVDAYHKQLDRVSDPPSSVGLTHLDVPGYVAGGLFEDVSERAQRPVDQLAVADTGLG